VPTVIGVETAKGVETTYSVDATGEDVSWWIVKSFSPRGCHLHFDCLLHWSSPKHFAASLSKI
jgi:hypothetical protein